MRLRSARTRKNPRSPRPEWLLGLLRALRQLTDSTPDHPFKVTVRDCLPCLSRFERVRQHLSAPCNTWNSPNETYSSDSSCHASTKVGNRATSFIPSFQTSHVVLSIRWLCCSHHSSEHRLKYSRKADRTAVRSAGGTSSSR